MPRRRDPIVVFVTCGTATEADRIAHALVEQRLAACVNVHEARVRSTYRWQGKVETAAEHLLVIKTARRLFARLEAAIQQRHSYQVPEIIAVPIVLGSPPYLHWLDDCLLPETRSRRKKASRT